MNSAREWLEKIHALQLPGRVRIMHVCGGQERTLTLSGLRSTLPPSVEIVSGPGCPTCVCPEEDIYQAMQLALREQIILASFSDMLRVPLSTPAGVPGSLAEAQAAGADIRPIASPLEARMIAEEADRPVVLFGASFETNLAPVAAMLLQGVPRNLSLLLTARRSWPAVAKLLQAPEPGFEALIAPGHVAALMGPEEWAFVPQGHGMPAAVAAFTATGLLAATWSVLQQLSEGAARLDNCYQSLVRPGGNAVARAHLQQVFELGDADWRSIGRIEMSGFYLREQWAAHDARRLFSDYRADLQPGQGRPPRGCDCAQVVLGRIYPNQCRLFGQACNLRQPAGPCMVSEEGACRIWIGPGDEAA